MTAALTFRQKGGKTNINILNKMQRIKDFRLHIKNFLEKIAKLKVLSHTLWVEFAEI